MKFVTRVGKYIAESNTVVGDLKLDIELAAVLGLQVDYAAIGAVVIDAALGGENFISIFN